MFVGTTRPWLVLIVVGSVMLLVDRVATATSSVNGLGGRILSHFDVGRNLIVVAGAVLLLRPWCAPQRQWRAFAVETPSSPSPGSTSRRDRS